MPDLVITDLTIEYSSGGYTARPIDHLHLKAGAGALTLLLGPSGCGKTSLLSCLGGILKPRSGSIRFGDIEVESLTGKELTEYRRHSVGIVFQSFNLIPSLTALENVTVPMTATGSKWSAASRRAEELLESVGLAERLYHRPGDMSGGQQQRVAIARALALSPTLILADEPTAHLDYLQVEGVLKVLRELASGEIHRPARRAGRDDADRVGGPGLRKRGRAREKTGKCNRAKCESEWMPFARLTEGRAHWVLATCCQHSVRLPHILL